MTTFGLGAMADNSEKVKEQRRPDGAGPKISSKLQYFGEGAEMGNAHFNAEIF